MANLKEILKGEVYLTLREWLWDKCRELKNIESVKELSDAKAQTIELKAQKKAYRKLKEMLKEIIDIAEMKEKSEKPSEEDYGL